MIYIYNCYAGTHSSSLASAVHLGQLPADRLPTRDEIINAPYFNKLSKKDMGKLIYRGTDDQGHKVYTLGRGSSKILIKGMENLLNLLHGESGVADKVIFSNMSPAVPPAMTFGGMLSRALGIHFLGVPLLVLGSKQTYKTIIELVRLTKERAGETDTPVAVFDNAEDVIRINHGKISF